MSYRPFPGPFISYKGLLIAPILVWTTPSSNNTPAFDATVTQPVIGDIITLQYTLSTDTSFASPIASIPNTIDSSEAAASLVQFNTGVLANNDYLFRANMARDAFTSRWSNVVPVTIAASSLAGAFYPLLFVA